MTGNNANSSSIKALIYLIKQYLKGAMHENADLRVKALEKLYTLLREKNSEIVFLIERQENTQIISEIMLALLNGCRDSDHRVKLLCGSCLGEIGAIDPANFMILAINQINNGSGLNTSSSNTSLLNSSLASNSSKIKPSINSPVVNASLSNTSLSSSMASPSLMSSTADLLMNPSLVSDDSNEFSENFSHSLIIELSKAYLAARNTHEQDSASYAIQECLKIYGCSLSSSVANGPNKLQNVKLWNSFPDYFKEILIPLQTSKYEIQSFDNLGSLKIPIILTESKTYEEWIYKWCAYLISKIDTHFSKNLSATDSIDRELKVFPKLQFINRFNVNVSLFILPYVIIKMIIYSNNEITEQIYEEIMSVIQLNKLIISQNTNTPPSTASSTIIATAPTSVNAAAVLNNNNTNNNNTNININININNNINGNNLAANSTPSTKMILQYHHICCQTVNL